MYSLYPVTMDTETLDTEAMDRQSVEKLSTETQPTDRQSIEENSMDRQMVDDEQIEDAEPGITVVSVTIQSYLKFVNLFIYLLKKKTGKRNHKILWLIHLFREFRYLN